MSEGEEEEEEVEEEVKVKVEEEVEVEVEVEVEEEVEEVKGALIFKILSLFYAKGKRCERAFQFVCVN